MTADASTVERHLPFGSVFNFRDLGGYVGLDGCAVRWRTLFRADGLHRLDGDDLATFAELGIRTVVDLRTTAELAERGRFEPGDAAYHHLPIIETIWDRESFQPDDDPAEFLADRYLEMLDVGDHAITGALSLVADPANLPLVFHCAAGKDRTGVVAAIVLHLLGVPDRVIAHDYSLSGAGMEKMRAWIEASFPEAHERMADQPAAFMAAPAEAMARFLAAAARRFGSLDAYVAGIGVTPDIVAAVRANLLEPPP
jgi:protein tyrosine/serine phosphatase